MVAQIDINAPVPSEFVPFDPVMPMVGVFFRHMNDHPFEGPDADWRLCDILFVSESWVIVRTLDSANPEELAFEPAEVEFAHGLKPDEALNLKYQHMYDLLMDFSVRCLFEAGWRLVKEEESDGVPF